MKAVLVFVCEIDGGKRRTSLPQSWTDRGPAPLPGRFAADGLTAARELIDALEADCTPISEMLPEEHSDEVRIGVRWHTGATDEITAGRPGPNRTPAAALELIRRHGATHDSEQLAVMLNAAGLRTGRGHRWSKAGVARVRAYHTVRAPRTVAIRNGEISVKQAAAELGITADAIYNWLAHGQVPARRAPGGRWCIPWDPDTQEIYREKVANSFRLNPIHPPAET
ncbi:hypothetical protein KRMM14A1259_47580 [Krasilnikovia sp. MM14-A1259]